MFLAIVDLAFNGRLRAFGDVWLMGCHFLFGCHPQRPVSAMEVLSGGGTVDFSQQALRHNESRQRFGRAWNQRIAAFTIIETKDVHFM